VSRRAGARTRSCDFLRRLYPEEASLEDEVDLGLVHLVDVVGQRFPEVGVRGEAAVAPVDFGDGERDALTSGSVDQTVGERAVEPEMTLEAAGLLAMTRNTFGVMPSCFLTVSSRGCAARGEAAMEAGVVRRDTGIPRVMSR
jgi:hypothetical protein